MTATPRLGPAACQGCGRPVYWSSHRWHDGRGNNKGRHTCPGPRCGALMKCGERCARKTGHGYEHRTEYALENARRMRTGHAGAVQ